MDGDGLRDGKEVGGEGNIDLWVVMCMRGEGVDDGGMMMEMRKGMGRVGVQKKGWGGCWLVSMDVVYRKDVGCEEGIRVDRGVGRVEMVYGCDGDEEKGDGYVIIFEKGIVVRRKSEGLLWRVG